jgi:uncharacterized membrane protein YhiD involved in acid resistance
MGELLGTLDSVPVGGDRSVEAMLLSFLLAFVLGQLVAWVYSRTHSGLSYSRSFTQSLVIMTLVVSLVMFVIGNSIVTAFGLLGALALIRFRNVLKDTRDTVFVFISLVVGMAVGTQRYLLAIIGTAVLILVVLFLELTAFGTLGRFDGYVTIRGSRRTDGEAERVLRRHCREIKHVSSRHSDGPSGEEVVYEIGLRDRSRGDDLLEELRRVAGVAHASLMIRTEYAEV